MTASPDKMFPRRYVHPAVYAFHGLETWSAPHPEWFEFIVALLWRNFTAKRGTAGPVDFLRGTANKTKETYFKFRPINGIVLGFEYLDHHHARPKIFVVNRTYAGPWDGGPIPYDPHDQYPHVLTTEDFVALELEAAPPKIMAKTREWVR